MSKLNKFKVGDIYKAKSKISLIFIITKVRLGGYKPLITVLIRSSATGKFNITSEVSAETIRIFYTKIL